MSENKGEGKKKKSQGGGGPNNVVSMPVRCVAEGCNAKPKRLNFCEEHFIWFKEGLITRDGRKAKDFDKKHQDWIAREKRKAARAA